VQQFINEDVINKLINQMRQQKAPRDIFPKVLSQICVCGMQAITVYQNLVLEQFFD